MIKNIKPVREYVKSIPETESRGKIRIKIKVYDQPVMIAENTTIYSIIVIEEEVDGNFVPFGNQMYDIQITEEQVKEAFTNIMNDPEKFKSV